MIVGLSEDFFALDQNFVQRALITKKLARRDVLDEERKEEVRGWNERKKRV